MANRVLRFRLSGAASVPATFAGLLTLALILASPALLASEKHKRWLNQEVVWIISNAEKEEFEALLNDAHRDAFIEEFWQRRDPTPSTERNEYKEEHYRRLAFVRKMFREGIPGWKTDRGRVYLLHGPPDKESFFRSRSAISPTRQLPTTARSPNTIVWTYHQNHNAKYYKGEVRLIFQPSSTFSRKDFALSESKTAQDRADQFTRQFFPASDPNWLEADVRYKLVMAGPPALINDTGADLPTAGVGETARYMQDIFRSPGELLEEREAELQRRREVMAELRQSIQSDIRFGAMELALSGRPVKRGGGDWLVPVRLHLPTGDLAKSRVDIYAVVLDAGDGVVDEFIDSVSVPAASTGLDAFYLTSFSIPDGSYKLRVIAKPSATDQTAIAEKELELVSHLPEKLEFGATILTSRVEMVPPQENEESMPVGEGLVFQGLRLMPDQRQHFQKEDVLFLFMQLWLPAGGAQVSLNANFIRDGAVVGRLDSRLIENTDAMRADYGTAVPLSSLEPGAYTLQLQAIDHTSRTFDIERIGFIIGP